MRGEFRVMQVWEDNYSKMSDMELVHEYPRSKHAADEAKELDALQVTHNTYPAIRERLEQLLTVMAQRFMDKVLLEEANNN